MLKLTKAQLVANVERLLAENKRLKADYSNLQTAHSELLTEHIELKSQPRASTVVEKVVEKPVTVEKVVEKERVVRAGRTEDAVEIARLKAENNLLKRELAVK